MLRGYRADEGRLTPASPLPADLAGVVWLDLMEPTGDEEAQVEAALGIDVPTREEMAEIEISSRLYEEDGALFMTAVLPAKTAADQPLLLPVTFVRVGDRLVTVRYHEPRAFHAFSARLERTHELVASGAEVMLGLLDVVVDRLADILETAGAAIDGISRQVFGEARGKPIGTAELRELVRGLGRNGNLVSKVRDSLVSLDRLAVFFAQHEGRSGAGKRIKTIARDVHSLTSHADFLAQKITFILDATLGLVNIEQSAIIKIVSVVAVVFLPPTLVASIYGMNFEVMPELAWDLGYPLALGLMLVSAILPFVFFKRLGWL